MKIDVSTQTKVLDLLRNPEGLPWTIQGFGMLRLYTDDEQIGRFHIWDTEEMAVSDVTRTHDHPWDFTSRIVSGSLTNLRFEYTEHKGMLWDGLLIKTGEDAHRLGEPKPFWLSSQDPEHYVPGDTYHQDAPEIHESMPSRGAVTIVERNFSRQRDQAMVFSRAGARWVDAKVHVATPEQVKHFTELALARWQS